MTASQASQQGGTGRHVLVGLSGGIACYKIAEIVSRLVQEGTTVTVAMTEAAARFVSPLTFQALSGRPVYDSPWTHIEANDPQHVSLARSADLMLIAPCTMDMMARLAHGHASDVVSLIASAVDRSRQPVILAPSMNEVMWNQPATRRNLALLQADGYEIVGPGRGWQACRTEGVGRMAEVEEVLSAVRAALR